MDTARLQRVCSLNGIKMTWKGLHPSCGAFTLAGVGGGWQLMSRGNRGVAGRDDQASDELDEFLKRLAAT